jgi:hypothetical protein
VAVIWDCTQRCLDVVPSPLVVQAASNQLRDECAAASASSSLVELGHERVINGNVQSHVSTIAR